MPQGYSHGCFGLKTTLGYFVSTVVDERWKGHSGACGVEELRCGSATLSYSGITLGSVLWKGYFGLLRDHFGQCAVEATQGSLWGVCCGSATLGYSGITLASVLWKKYFGLLRVHFG